jgi:TATA-box binding protein (TBP) (component of TFIID and TFIIIB)
MMHSLHNLVSNLNHLDFEEEVKERSMEENMEECELWEGQRMKVPNNTRISTLTAVTNLNTELYVSKICKDIQIVPYYENREGIIRTEMFSYLKGSKKKQTIRQVRGSCKKDYIEKKKPKKPFFNAASVYLKLKDENGVNKEPNLKIFHNGGVQMTGITSVEMGERVINMFMTEINKLDNVCKNPEKLHMSNIRICLVNSDFSFDFYIRRNVLHRILTTKYDLISSFESTNYQGINTKFFWNKDYKGKPGFGKCLCEKHCSGKGEGNGQGDCKKITIAPFQTGRVIITGARTIEQLDDARGFICDVISKHYGIVRSDKEVVNKKKIKARRISKKKLMKIPYTQIEFNPNSVCPEPNLINYLTQPQVHQENNVSK